MSRFNLSSPADQFITAANQMSTEPVPEKKTPAAGSNKEKTTEPKTETKSRRLDLLVKPSLYDDLKVLAAAKQTSVNDLINSILTEHLKGQQSIIDKYKEFFG